MSGLKNTLLILIILFTLVSHGQKNQTFKNSFLEIIYNDLLDIALVESIPILLSLDNGSVDQAIEVFDTTYNDRSIVKELDYADIPEEDVFLIYQMSLFVKIVDTKIWKKQSSTDKLKILQVALLQKYTTENFKIFLFKQIKKHPSLKAKALIHYMFNQRNEVNHSELKRTFPEIVFERLRLVFLSERFVELLHTGEPAFDREKWEIEKIYKYITREHSEFSDNYFNLERKINHLRLKSDEMDLFTRYYIAYVVQGYDLNSRKSPIDHFNSSYYPEDNISAERFVFVKNKYFKEVLVDIEKSMMSPPAEIKCTKVITKDSFSKRF